jgi:hypothetical protein
MSPTQKRGGDIKMDDVLDPVDTMNSTARWEHRGEEIRTLADEACDPTVRAILLSLAADCDFLARHAEPSSLGQRSD